MTTKDTSLADPVTHGELQAELSRFREAIAILAVRLGNDSGADSRRILELLYPPSPR